MELIVSEKDNAARRIAEILSGGSASTDREAGVQVYRWGGKRCIGLSGHVVGVDFPEEYSDWNKVDPSELVEAEIVKTPTKENIVTALKRLARDADRVTIATDYDREGELIGKEAYELVKEANEAVPIDRVRFSSITENEVTSAFADPDDLDFDLAAAGEARQTIDLLWGAALTRFLSLAAKQYGDDFISVGRVQSPTLKLLVDREKEIRAFDPDDYWEIFADLLKDGDDQDFESQYYYLDSDDNEAERIWSEDEADAVYSALEGAQTAEVTEVDRRTRTDNPPAPFNTTQFIKAAGAIGLPAKRAMSVAEDLYTAGFITYPRTDNTVYPDDLDPRDLVETLAGERAFREDARSLMESEGSLSPTRGENETTDHPPIHPTFDLPDESNLSDQEWRVYELVVRRFFATLADPATWEHLRVVVDANGLALKANGKRLVEPGYHAVYPYFNTDENYVPDVKKGEVLDVTDTRLEEKQTQPPRRYGQSRLVEKMEEMGIGTKCLTADTPVLARNGEGDIVRQSASNLFEQGQVVMGDGDADIAVNEQGPTTLSFDETTGRLDERESTLVSERPLRDDERVLTFVTETGSFSVTDDHPVYLRDEDGVTVKPAGEVTPGDKLLSARSAGPEPTAENLPPVATWEEFTTDCDWSTKLYGLGCNQELAKLREELGETQAEFADRFHTDRGYISIYENERRDPPAWLLGEAGIKPDRLRGLNEDDPISNPFPLEWSPTLVRILGHLLGDGSIHINDEENVVDVRYHNTDRQLIDRFASDIESLFGTSPTISERPGRKDHHKTKYQVNLPSAIGRVLVYVLDTVSEGGCPDVPEALVPWFVGALFDDEGHISRERKVFISNTDHELLAGVETMLDELGVGSKLAPSQHKLHVRGRKNLEPFLDSIPIAADEKFYRGLDGLDHYDLTHQKARILELTRNNERTSDELAEILDLNRPQVQKRIRDLRAQGHLEKRVEGSNRSHNGLRTIRYAATGFEDSVYTTLLGYPSSVTVLDVSERDYDGEVYDLSIDESAPNFAVEGGAIVHNSTRHNTIEKLYDRGYVEQNPPRPTQLAIGVVEAAEEYAELVVSEEMTAQLEEDMTAIAEGEATFEEITEESRDMLERVFEELEPSEEEIGEHIREALKKDKELGPCPECGEQLLIRKSRHGSHFVGCDGYPDCEYTLPLPNNGNPLVLEEVCEEHDLHHVKMLAGRGTFVHGCPQCKADEADDEEDRVIGECPDCGEEEGGELAIKTVRSGSRLVGCTRYPDCDYSLPLPRRGDIEVTDEYCDEHDLPELVIHNGDEPWELGCPICNYIEYQAQQQEDENSLESIEGIGAKTKEKLEEAGIEDVEDLTEADADDLAGAVQGISADRIRDWQTDAEA